MAEAPVETPGETDHQAGDYGEPPTAQDEAAAQAAPAAPQVDSQEAFALTSSAAAGDHALAAGTAAFATGATPFAIGDHVEYFSRSQQKWIPAKVQSFQAATRTYELDVVPIADADSVRMPDLSDKVVSLEAENTRLREELAKHQDCAASDGGAGQSASGSHPPSPTAGSMRFAKADELQALGVSNQAGRGDAEVVEAEAQAAMQRRAAEEAAAAAGGVLSGVYTFENVNAVGKYLNFDGIEVQIRGDRQLPSSQWKISGRDGMYTLESVDKPGKYLGGYHDFGRQGDAKILDSPHSSSAKWKISNNNGVYSIENVDSKGKVLAVWGKGTADGSKVHMWDNPTSTATQWLLEKVPSSSGATYLSIPAAPDRKIHDDDPDEGRRRRTPSPCRGRKPDTLEKPNTNEFSVNIPNSRQSKPVIAFYFPGHKEQWDRMCQASFLGNFFELQDKISVHPKGRRDLAVKFTNAEAAFQALKFWGDANKFAPLSGDGAFTLKRNLSNPDRTYSGWGSNWNAMEHVLQQKFDRNTECARYLQKTGEAFLLEHNSVSGRDNVWSDNSIGDGTNWLGLQLMKIRDQLFGQSYWETYLPRHIDLSSGAPVPGKDWQDLVQAACDAVNSRLGVRPVAGHAPAPTGAPICGCGKPTYNGRWGELCSRSCPGPKLSDPSDPWAARVTAGVTGAICGCGKPTYNGRWNERCSRSCTVGVRADPSAPSAGFFPWSSPAPAPAPPAPRGAFCGCGKPTWNGHWNELCTRSCPGPRVMVARH